MIPATFDGRALIGLRRSGSLIAFSVETIKGVAYAQFSSTAGSYVAQYAPDTTAPTIANVTVTLAWPSAVVTWTTNEPSGSTVTYGTSAASLSSTATVGGLTRTHSVTLTGLAEGTTYFYRVNSADLSGNSRSAPASPNPPNSFRIEGSPSLYASVNGSVVNESNGLVAGMPTTWTAAATGLGSSPEYKYWVLSDVGWRVVQEYSTDPVLRWTPARAGRYVVQVWARTAGSTAAWQTYRTTAYFDVVAPAPITVTTFSPSPALPSTTGVPVMWHAAASGGAAPLQYQFFLLEPGTGWRVLQSWSALRSVAWTPRVPGSYAAQVWVRNAGSTAAYEAWRGTGLFNVANGPLTVAGLTANRPLPVGPGATVTWTAAMAGGDGSALEYQFYRYNATAQAWTLVQPYSPTPSWTWTPGLGDTGPYWLQVWVRRQGSPMAWEAWANSREFAVTSAPLAVTLTSSQGDPPSVPANTPIRWQVSATGATGPLEYVFWRFDGRSGTWTQVQPYGPTDFYAWTPALDEAGYWALQVWVRRVGSGQAYEAWAGTTYFTIQP